MYIYIYVCVYIYTRAHIYIHTIKSSPAQLQRRQGPKCEGEARLYNEVGGSETSGW